jgi:hypothetical protein
MPLIVIPAVIAAYFLVVYVTVPLFLLAVSVGMIFGTVVAAAGYLRVLAGAEDDTLMVLPGALGRRGPRAAYPRWDRAWPVYLAWQADRDLHAALGMPRRLVARQFRWIWSYLSDAEVLPVLLLWSPLLLPAIGFYLGLSVGVFAAWAAIAVTLEIALLGPRLLAIAVAGLLRGWDQTVRWWRASASMCRRCGWVMAVPAFRCDRCRIIHRDLLPGLLGVGWHRCQCGRRLSTTVIRAAGQGLKAHCLHCDAMLPNRPPMATSARIAFAGPAASGTSSLIRAASQALCGGAGVQFVGGPRDLLRVATLRLADADGGYFVDLIDLDGKQFARDPDPPLLWEIRTTRRHVLTVDARRLAHVQDLRGTMDQERYDAELAYRILVAQLHRYGLGSRRCTLAVVITRADVLVEIDASAALTDGDRSSDHVRDWLARRGLENLVLAAERDFGAVAYFLTSAGSAHDNRWMPAEVPVMWLLQRHRHGVGVA